LVDEHPTQLDDAKEAELRQLYLKERIYKFNPILQAIEDPNWKKPVSIPIGDAVFEFKKFTHGEIALLTTLPYSSHLDKLTDAEKADYRVFQKLMVGRVAVEPARWMELVKKEPKWIELVFGALVNVSTVNLDNLKELFASDFGWNYGMFWFLVMRMTPTEVGALSEGDYQAIMTFLGVNREKISRMVGIQP